jgi:hypothetical protein
MEKSFDSGRQRQDWQGEPGRFRQEWRARGMPAIIPLIGLWPIKRWVARLRRIYRLLSIVP